MPLRPKLDTCLTQWRAGQIGAPEVWNGFNGQFVPVHNHTLLIEGQQVILRAAHQIAPDVRVGIHLLQTAADRVDNYYIGTQYRQVLNNVHWQTLYQVAARDYIEVHGTNAIQLNGHTVPCHQCGLVMPLPHITVDHQKPQEGGEFAAVLKLFHTLGCHLTHATAVGPKGQALLTGNIQAIGTKVGRPDVGRTDPAWRYTLTGEGIVFLSLAVAASGNQLNNYAMHSLVNLAPMCLRCNARKNNGRVDLSQIND